MNDLLEAVGKVAGIGGVALGVLLLFSATLFVVKCFPAAVTETYRLMRLLVVLTFVAACLGIWHG